MIGEENHNLSTFLTEDIVSVDVTMAASVEDPDGDATENSWTFTKVPDTIADPTFSVPVNALDVTVNFTEAGIYTLTLTAIDPEDLEGSDSLVVTVYANGCDAKINEDGYDVNAALARGDFNYNCETDLDDLTLLASKWLESKALNHANGCDAAKAAGYDVATADSIGDTNYDCKVNLADFADMALIWQEQDGTDLADLAVMASNWLADVSE